MSEEKVIFAKAVEYIPDRSLCYVFQVKGKSKKWNRRREKKRQKYVALVGRREWI